MLDESQIEDIGQVGPDMNHFVDTILRTVFENKGKRNVVFSSFHPDICTMLSLKQPSIPILFLTDSGCSPVADVRSSSLQNAIRFARKWNLLGIVTNAKPIVKCPRLASVIKASGLVCVTYGSENNDPTNVKLEMTAGIDAIIADSVLAVRKELTKLGKEGSNNTRENISEIDTKEDAVLTQQKDKESATKRQVPVLP
ncbi:glycerophosphodiester phosphodiesterase gde1 [Brettanomyces bruxellensis AWRI1499]|nr:glycerophosphodiester phosphodiesterase gde1 [Brettanomyces bruxellensis AWRI1499]